MWRCQSCAILSWLSHIIFVFDPIPVWLKQQGKHIAITCSVSGKSLLQDGSNDTMAWQTLCNFLNLFTYVSVPTLSNNYQRINIFCFVSDMCWEIYTSILSFKDRKYWGIWLYSTSKKMSSEEMTSSGDCLDDCLII